MSLASPLPDEAPIGPVHIVGTGLIGTSVGLALRPHGVHVTLADPSPTAVALASDLGAGSPRTADSPAPELVLVAAPPDVAAQVAAQALVTFPEAVVTDVASIKQAVYAGVLAFVPDPAVITRYVGSHPMAGRERSGAIAAQADLFEGRPWVVTPHATSDPRAVRMVETLARIVGASVRTMPADEHDEAVAAVSHIPQLAASLVAGRLRELPTASVGLAGQGLRDVTRIAASSPVLWTQILTGNAGAVRRELQEIAKDLDTLIGALGRLDEDPTSAAGARAVLARIVADGNAGQARIPGKHGASPTAYTVVVVLVPDRPGSLASLLAEVGQAGVNLEDLHIEHGEGRLVGLAELSVVPAAADPLRAALRERGWTVYD